MEDRDIVKKYGGRFVAINRGKVIASSFTLKEVYNKALRAHEQDGLYFAYIPRNDILIL
ncbi:MAG: DUF5678 domain-containing protein [Thermoprotei archaeon]